MQFCYLPCGFNFFLYREVGISNSLRTPFENREVLEMQLCVPIKNTKNEVTNFFPNSTPLYIEVFFFSGSFVSFLSRTLLSVASSF